MATDIRFPDVNVQLSDEDGNAYFIVGRTQEALRRGGATSEEVDQYRKEALSGDYRNVFITTMRWVNVSE